MPPFESFLLSLLPLVFCMDIIVYLFDLKKTLLTIVFFLFGKSVFKFVIGIQTFVLEKVGFVAILKLWKI